MSQNKWKNKNTIAELSRKSGLKYNTIYNRVKVLNWDLNIAVNTSLVTPKSYKKIINKLNGNIGR